MEITLKSDEKPITLPKHINEFSLKVSAMSGDADHYEKKEHFATEDFPILVIAKLLVEGIFYSSGINGGARMDDMCAFYKPKFAELGMEEDWAWDFIYEYIGNDVTYEGEIAQLDEIKVFWYDAEGKKCAAKLVVDGKEYNMIDSWTVRGLANSQK
jgi:hypothetical protein